MNHLPVFESTNYIFCLQPCPNSSSQPKAVSNPRRFICLYKNPPHPRHPHHAYMENTVQSLYREALPPNDKVSASRHFIPLPPHHAAPQLQSPVSQGARRTMHERELLQPWRLSPAASAKEPVQPALLHPRTGNNKRSTQSESS